MPRPRLSEEARKIRDALRRTREAERIRKRRMGMSAQERAEELAKNAARNRTTRRKRTNQEMATERSKEQARQEKKYATAQLFRQSADIERTERDERQSERALRSRAAHEEKAQKAREDKLREYRVAYKNYIAALEARSKRKIEEAKAEAAEQYWKDGPSMFRCYCFLEKREKLLEGEVCCSNVRDRYRFGWSLGDPWPGERFLNERLYTYESGNKFPPYTDGPGVSRVVLPVVRGLQRVLAEPPWTPPARPASPPIVRPKPPTFHLHTGPIVRERLAAQAQRRQGL